MNKSYSSVLLWTSFPEPIKSLLGLLYGRHGDRSGYYTFLGVIHDHIGAQNFLRPWIYTDYYEDILVSWWHCDQTQDLVHAKYSL